MSNSNYLFSIRDSIELYQNLLINGNNVEAIFENLRRYRSNIEIINLSRFRIFLDSCMVKVNKEKMESDFANKFSYAAFLERIKKESTNQNGIFPDIIKQKIKAVERLLLIDKYEFFSGNLDVALFYPIPTQSFDADQQAKIIRNAFAHSQFSSFRNDSDSRQIQYFTVDNFDSSRSCSIHGIVIEEIVHEWIRAFFSNSPICGIPYKHTFFTVEVNDNNEIIDNPIWVTLSLSDTYSEVYDGYTTSHPMKEIANYMCGELLSSYISENKDVFIISKQYLYDCISKDKLLGMCNHYIKIRATEFTDDLLLKKSVCDAVKTILDPDTQISNFVFSLSYLNDAIIQWVLAKDDSKLKKALEEIQQDDDESILSFRIGFAVLSSWLVAYILELDKESTSASNKTIQYFSSNGVPMSIHFDYSKIDISGFVYDANDANNYIRSNNSSSNALVEYVLKRFRDALMHGSVKIEIDEKNQINIVFIDISPKNKKIRELRISLEQLEKFIDNHAFYDEISAKGIEL